MADPPDPTRALASFVPDVLLERLAEGVTPPAAIQVTGTLLLSDIRGFTTHVEAASALGAVGIEAFNARLSEYMDLHIAEVRARGGDILDLAGDSFLCLWAADRATPADAARAAVDAAVAVQRRLVGFDIADGIPIEVRIGIASGPVDLFLVGPSDRRCELLTLGPTAVAVADAEQTCPSGAITADAATVRLLGDAARWAPLDGGLATLDELRDDDREFAADDAAHCHVDLDLDLDMVGRQTPRIARVLIGRLDDAPPEFRRLSIIHASTPDVEHDVESAHALVSRFHETIERYDGDASVAVDGKGPMMIATFGAQFASHENDPERAILAAMELAAATEHTSELSIGVATGRALHGISGNERRRAITIAGEVVNVASRLAATADGRVVCDHGTAALAGNRAAFTVMNPIRVKGKVERVPVFRPIELLDPNFHEVVSVRGRESERDTIRSVLGDRSGPRAIALVAEAGLGKSTLVADLAAEIRGRGEVVLTARADSIDHSAPYGAWTGVVRAVLGVDRSAPASLVVQRAAERLRGPEHEHVALLGDVLGTPLDTSDDPAIVALSSDRRVAATAAVVARLCCGDDGPDLLVVEDTHWLDASSWTVLATIAAAADRPPLLCSGRDLTAELSQVVAATDATVVELAALDRAAVAALVADRLGASTVPDHLVDVIVAQAGGHPLFSDQLLKALIEDGIVRSTGRRVTVGRLDTQDVPSTIEAVVVGRFDRLPVDEQLCLKAAAAIGADIDLGTVSAAVGADQADALNRLARSGFVRRDGTAHAFHHAVSRDVVYSLMPHAQRVQLHRAIAEHLQATNAGAHRIGHHFRLAGDVERAHPHLMAAGDEALRTGRFGDARDLYDQVEALGAETVDDTRQRAVVRTRRATAAFYQGDMTQALTDLEAAIALIDRPLPESDDDLAREDAELTSGRHQPVDRSERDDRALLDAYQRISQLRYLRGAQPLELLVPAGRALAIAERLEDASAEAWARSQLSAVSGMLARPEQFDEHARRAVELVRSGRADSVATDVWRTLAVGHAGAARFSDALEALVEAEATASESGPGRTAGILQTRAAIHLCAGDYIGAEPAWSAAAAVGAAIGNDTQVRWSRLDEIQTAIGRDHVDTAAELLAAFDADGGEPSDPLGRIEYHFTTALVRSAEGDDVAACRSAAIVVDMVAAVPPSGFHWVEFCSGAVEVYLAALTRRVAAGHTASPELLDDIDQGTTLLADLSRSFRHVASRVTLTRGLVELHAGGRREAGVRSLRQACDEALALDLRFDAARATALAEWYGGDPDHERLRAVEAVFAELGADRWRHRVERLLAGGALVDPAD